MIAEGAQHFEDFDGITYLNCASQGPLPRVTDEAIRGSIPLKTFPNRIPDTILFELPNRVRNAVAPLMGVPPEEVMIGAGASHGMNQAALGFPLQPGDEVVVATNDFPSNIYTWCGAAERHNAKAVLVRGRRHAATTEEILSAITLRTRVVSVSLVDFGSGEVVDMHRLGSRCREGGIFLAVDATQAVGVVPLNAKELGVSLMTVGAYKWMLAPYGSGFAYLDPEWWDRIPPAYVTWTASEGAEDFNTLPREDWRWVGTARRYDGPETASFLNLTGLARSAEFIGEIGRPRIYEHVTGLLAELERNLPAPFRRRASPSAVAGPILSIESDDPSTVHRAYAAMREAGIWVSLREDGIRVSPHIYNTLADVERLLTHLSGR